ncbi:hypothetical protein FB451DRAFT_1429514 [Mycena latifolia]|nr:hypothetical protein FB451DRAFT_1429514 [Mycena latifolia]
MPRKIGSRSPIDIKERRTGVVWPTLEELLTDSDMSGLGLGGAYGAPSPLRSFASLPSPDLDDLELNMELTRHRQRHAGPRAPPFPSSTAEHTADPPPALAPDRANALMLYLPPAPPVAALLPSPLDALGPAALATLLALRARAAAALTHALATASTSCCWGCRKGNAGVRAAGRGGAAEEAQAREGGGEGSGGAGRACAEGVADVSEGVRCLVVVVRLHFRLYIFFAGADDLAKQKKRRGEKAEKAGLTSGVLRVGRRCGVLMLDAEGGEGEESPPMEVAPLPSMAPPPMELVL